MAYDADASLNLNQYHSVIDLIEIACKKYPNRRAYACLGHDMTFAEIDKASGDFAAYLQSQSTLTIGSRIAIQLPNINQFVIAAYGVIRAGMVLVNTNPLYTERELIHQYNDSGAKALITLTDLLPTLTNVVKQTQLETVIATHPLDLIHPQPIPDAPFAYVPFLDALNQGQQCQYQAVTVSSADIVALQYTGGTTGLSKGAMLSHGNLLANTAQVKSRLASHMNDGEDIFIAPLPIYHIYAFMLNLMLTFESGSCSVLIPNPRDINGLINTMASYPFTCFAGLNTLFVGLCHQAQFKALDFSHLRLTISGGTALTGAAAQLWQQTTHCMISEGYGLSETSPVVSLNAPGYERLGTIGKPVLATQVKIIDVNDDPVKAGQPGELAVKGPQVMQGYWNKPAETASVMTADGFFKTGDIAIEMEDGFHAIVDRKKDMIIVSGFNVFPNEVENVLAQHPQVLECAVVGIDDAHSGEAVKAVIVLSQVCDDESLLIDDIRQHCKTQLTGYKVPKHIVITSQLPKSTVGKILRRALRQ
ncbi:AMP-binding protein [Shewanella intestini]|uniref:Long-chain-fatty-acid--CoA ligase n=1 Tax=Shewanella intestini TaxID=2017544 RepID=A0ABS5HXC9_9GAMM|nr:MULTISPECIES: AMP-binding protein [Shewanella]MBR9726390.1 AMP-binding protein [Shewanella intestini]MRG35044.1 AMP-binding protein [Shewanella sp. XMDDZSB0408]